MENKPLSAKKMKRARSAQIRASIGFPSDMYETLETIAEKKKVSLAWVVREAVEGYLAEKWPLFAGKHDEQ
jgi:predicted DNA-binding protein